MKSRAALDDLVGGAAAAAIVGAAGAFLPPHLAAAAGPPRIVLRRRAATGGDGGAHIIFHRDSAPAVVNVALNDSFTGGDLLYAVGGRLERPMRAAGVATAHDGATVHGVTALSAGVRYTLLVVFASRFDRATSEFARVVL